MNKPTKEEIYAKVNNDIDWIKDNTIFLTVHGFHSYGINVTDLDKDYVE